MSHQLQNSRQETFTTLQDLHDAVKQEADESFHKDVLIGGLTTAMHMHGPGEPCTSLPSRASLHSMLSKLSWKNGNPPVIKKTSSVSPQFDPSSVVKQNKAIQKAIDSLSRQMDDLSTHVSNSKAMTLANQSAHIPQNSLVVSPNDIQALVQHIQDIKEEPFDAARGSS